MSYLTWLLALELVTDFVIALTATVIVVLLLAIFLYWLALR